MNFIAAIVLIAAAFGGQKPYYSTLGIFCMLAALYQYSAFKYHTSESVATSLFWTSFQIDVSLLIAPLYVLIFAQWCKFKYARSAFAALFCISLIFITANFALPYGIRFSELPELTMYYSLSNNQISRLSGENTSWLSGFYIIGLTILISLLVFNYKLLKQRDYLTAGILSATIVMQIVTTVWAILIDQSKLNSVYLGGLPLTLLSVLACVTVSISLMRQTKSLKQEQTRTISLKKILTNIARGTESKDSVQFYTDMTKELGNVSGASFIYLGILKKDNKGEYIETRAAFKNGNKIKNFSYYLVDVPESLWLTTKIKVIESDVVEIYPSVPMFKNHNCKGYIGAPVLITSEKPQGVLVMLFEKEIQPDESLLNVIKVFASRAASEIIRNNLEEGLKSQAFVDYKTQLPNLASLQKLITNNVEIDSPNSYSLYIIDIDGFGEINHQYGFDVAEHILIEIAERLRSIQGESVFISRVGGDEFAILFKNTMASDFEVQQHWQKIKALFDTTFYSDLGSLQVQISGACVSFPIPERPSIDVFRCAEHALSIAKSRKENQFEVFSNDTFERIERNRLLKIELERALEKQDELFLVYQPKVDNAGRINGVETLTRWVSPTLGFVSPNEFIPIAESSGLIRKLGKWCLESACRQLAEWETNGFEFKGRLSVNVSAEQIVGGTFDKEVTSIVDSFGIQPSKIDLELTETSLLEDLQESINVLGALRTKGFSVSIDDFGTGYSSLSYLKKLPIDCIKIDRSFVSDIHHNSGSTLVVSIITIANQMKLGLVAEGVEEKEQLETLYSLGCRLFQGFYFSKPLRANDLLAKYGETQRDFAK